MLPIRFDCISFQKSVGIVKASLFYLAVKSLLKLRNTGNQLPVPPTIKKRTDPSKPHLRNTFNQYESRDDLTPFLHFIVC
jgi:hypothetical protein